jgi:septum site-determining protein MinC
MKTSLAIKGMRDGLLMTLPEGEWAEVQTELLQTIDEQADFFRGARLALQMEDRTLKAAELGNLRDSLVEREVMLWAVLSTSSTTRSSAADLGIAQELTRTPSQAIEEDLPLETALSGEDAVLLQRTLRSGHNVRHPGHVIVLGDVNPGAEIIAGGHIIVWGRLRGTVHAGAAGDESATVSALDLDPTQLRIAGQIAISPTRRGRARPEVARIREGQIVAEAWRNEQ